jgi:hypothetical protein
MIIRIQIVDQLFDPFSGFDKWLPGFRIIWRFCHGMK